MKELFILAIVFVVFGSGNFASNYELIDKLNNEPPLNEICHYLKSDLSDNQNRNYLKIVNTTENNKDKN